MRKYARSVKLSRLPQDEQAGHCILAHGAQGAMGRKHRPDARQAPPHSPLQVSLLPNRPAPEERGTRAPLQ